jgi:hypothetical protein
MAKKKWKDLSPAQQRWLIAGAAVEVVVTAVALRDLAMRPQDQVRGPKPLWALGCFVQPVGPPAYLLFGRRPASVD